MAKQEAQTRVYKVTAPGRPVRLVKATSQAAPTDAQAIAAPNHASDDPQKHFPAGQLAGFLEGHDEQQATAFEEITMNMKFRHYSHNRHASRAANSTKASHIINRMMRILPDMDLLTAKDVFLAQIGLGEMPAGALLTKDWPKYEAIHVRNGRDSDRAASPITAFLTSRLDQDPPIAEQHRRWNADCDAAERAAAEHEGMCRALGWDVDDVWRTPAHAGRWLRPAPPNTEPAGLAGGMNEETAMATLPGQLLHDAASPKFDPEDPTVDERVFRGWEADFLQDCDLQECAYMLGDGEVLINRLGMAVLKEDLIAAKEIVANLRARAAHKFAMDKQEAYFKGLQEDADSDYPGFGVAA